VAISYHSQQVGCKFFVPPATKESTAESAEIAEKNLTAEGRIPAGSKKQLTAENAEKTFTTEGHGFARKRF
jgi:hypothetical protein